MPDLSSASPRPMPARPNIEYLKNEAKRRLAAQRTAQPDLKLSTVQFEIAREYGFASWRALKAALEQPSAVLMEAAGDWIGRLPFGLRLALHVSPDGVTLDSPDYGGFGTAVPGFTAGGGRMSFAMPGINAAFQGEWEEDAEAWQGAWRQDGLEHPLAFTRGEFPPAPVIEGVDGIWEGLLGANSVRLIFRIWTAGAHGTYGLCDSPDRSGANIPLTSIERAGNQVTFRTKTTTFEGGLTETGNHIDGHFQRGDTSWPLNLRRRIPGDPPLVGPGIALSATALSACAGRYRFVDSDQEAQITVAGNILSARLSDGTRVDLVPVSAREFRLQQGVGRVVFDIGPGDGVAGLTLWSYSRRSTASRVG